jgi:hypothetical protein
MAKARTLVGLDDPCREGCRGDRRLESGKLRFDRLGGETPPVVDLCRSLSGPVRATYEAGPTSYGLARAMSDVPSSASSPPPTRSREGRPTGARPTVAMPSTWFASCSPDVPEFVS